MPIIVSAAEVVPPYEIKQEQVTKFARDLFSDTFTDIDRLLRAFPNGQIETRHFVKDLSWYRERHTFEEKNKTYIEEAVQFGKEAIEKCLNNSDFLKTPIAYEEIDAILFISSTGISTPSIDARIMNQLPFHSHTKRIPIWGLGCAGGASGLSRAFEYCLAFPEAKVIVLSVELCSLTFQPGDVSKSNLIGTSLFADGIACALVCGDDCNLNEFGQKRAYPSIIATESTLMQESLDVMGWDVKDDGLFVVFSRDIPHIIEEWLKPIVDHFLARNRRTLKEIDHFIAHPGGKKVLDAYKKAMGFTSSMTDLSFQVLKHHGNMSSATILYVLRLYLERDIPRGSYGLCTALGPGFSSELLLLRWVE
ncbi:type III polyketide synthase [Neobacillus dielmonensis]|uniref:type III polyketide synthase n=1 Tax=Neobacillus dielmonensis TaxID=1347369 RepID=UPI0005A8A224|nr:3-oxoacyl-[acyl-carrier-protein] synthase III C-terminal domain-containing protein [Neobacillus dielmonensis]